MNEVNWVISLVFDLAARGEIATLEKWKLERVAQLKKQAEVSAFSLFYFWFGGLFWVGSL